ncbi:piezo-type mechanosensitive ion channel homolog isoform X1 [Dioscorea cayenensis subsp. rotundata]|uniref:Piezo-type mechanosensitive ion channel homolog isoform X1 n=2 Tax=Dioscorea cayennensis subsp. rotundata TaxID=55577 RepID=A0AB40D5Z6_DIOCR|nr:piezo-type mechanosensitive ion channel homolog isoform X1 [Dioscorea cayenensis subsp. rotundata]
MGRFLGRFLLPFLLLAASLHDWSLISLVNLLMFIAFQFTSSRQEFRFRRLYLLSRGVVVFSLLSIVAEVIFQILWCIEGEGWSMADARWAKLVGFVRVQPWGSTSVIYIVVIQLAVALVSVVEAFGSNLDRDSCWLNFSAAFDRIGSHLKVACCLFLPAMQLVVGISHPSWISLPFFICSCVGLVDWSLTSNFLGLFRWWRPLLSYACFSVLLLYVYQLPVQFPSAVLIIADFIGLFKVTNMSEWPELFSGISLLMYFFMLSSVRSDLEEMDSIISMQDNTLTERLIPSNHSFFIRESRSGVRHTNVLLRRSVFRTFSINFFTYGFPVLLCALSFWSFTFASICAFGLLAYVGYVLYAFPSLFRLHRLNGLLLIFILLWAASTYVFNVAFTFLNKKLRKDMEIWETIGFWHYPIPGFFLLAQFCLGVLVAVGNLVNNSVFLYFSDDDGRSRHDDHTVEDKEDTKVLVVATIAWGLRKCSRPITLGLIFLLAMKPGFIHAVYMCFFLIFLLSYSISRKMRQALILFCEAHFSILYILQLNLVTKILGHGGSLTMEILSQLGLSGNATFGNFMEIGVLLCFCAVQNHGFKMLFAFSAIIQHTPYPPFGFSILKAGLNKSVLLSVYASAGSRSSQSSKSSHEKLIATYLGKVGQKFLSTYRSYGTYIAFVTILLTVYLMVPNYISFGYLFFLMFWIIGRQLVEKTRRRLWFPLKVYTTIVFVFTYSLSISSSFMMWLSKIITLYPDLGFNPEASLLENVWESLAVLIVMQLYSYERLQSRHNRTADSSDASELGILGFVRRFLIWHSDKILSAAVFYASISSISAFGFLYLVGLIICSTLPKASTVPSKFFLVYSGLLVACEYLFQMWGKLAYMFPGQKFYGLSLFLGLKSFDSGFWGLELGLRGKILVIVACTLQYNVFRWLEKMPNHLINEGKWEEPCQLFISAEYTSADTRGNATPVDSALVFSKQRGTTSKSWPSFSSVAFEVSDQMASLARGTGSSTSRYSFGYIWGSSKESHKWNKKRIIALRKERFEMQITTLKIYMRFWIENLFQLRGLEINMVALLVASFSALNVISMFYIMCLIACILLNRQVIRRLWPIFVFLFAVILVLEYFAIWKNLIPWIHGPSEVNVHCHDCWSSSSLHFRYCMKCWLGVIVDDPRIVVSYYLVFIFSSFKLRSDHLDGFSDSHTYQQMMSQRRNAQVWRDLSFETKSMWTFLDYLRLYSYCHLLDIVLALILITGTLEYDVLHLGYLGFALVFFRMRLEILKKKNQIFKFLRLYNFVVIVLSLAYQCPYLGDYSSGKCGTTDYIYEIIGFYKYDYGFRITSRSALVEIIIFLLVSMQSYIFCSREFDYVARYLEAEQIGAMVREQEKRAAWKTEQLLHIRKSEEQKRQRNLQVEKMKSEMLNLQSQLNSMNGVTNLGSTSPQNRGLRRRKNPAVAAETGKLQGKEDILDSEDQDLNTDSINSFGFALPDTQGRELISHVSYDILQSPKSAKSESSLAMDMKHLQDSLCEISELGEGDDTAYQSVEKDSKEKGKGKENPLVSAVQLIGDGVSQVQSLGNQAVTNIVSFLNIEHGESDSNGHSSAEDGVYDEIESQNKIGHGHFDRTTSVCSASGTTMPAASLQIGRIFRFIWSQMRSNNDVVCYCCFILVFLWNFSLLSMVYLGALFLYALCVNSGPTYLFWIIILIYTEFNILVQYLYQIIIQHCGLSINLKILQRLGFPDHKITASFVVSTLPLFLVYISTLLQSSITAKDGEWAPVTEFKLFGMRSPHKDDHVVTYSWGMRVWRFLSPVIEIIKIVSRGFTRYWMSLTQGSEAPPHFVQLSMKVDEWPDDGIQPERIESRINQLLRVVHEERCQVKIPNSCHSVSKVRIQSIEKSQESANVALAVLEVVYASPSVGCPAVEWYRSLTPAADVASEILKAKSMGLIEEIDFPYPIISVIGGGKREIDLYAYIFGADLAVFFLVAMFYQSVIKNNSKFLDVYQLEDQFPKEFVFILMILFFLIVLDRIIYLCSFAAGKLIFYIFNLILFTYSVTEYAWYMEPSHQRVGGFALRAIYLTKSVSLALQALQIQHGIPNKSTLYRQFLTSKVTQVNYLGFRLYRALPFLYELRCVLDWSCTTTSLTMYDWLKLEDINSSLFLVKCDAVLNRAGHKQGEKQTKTTKFCSGICLFFILICVIWAPMLMYSSGNPTNIANPIIDVTVHVDIKAAGGRLTLFQTTLCERFPWDKLDFREDLDRDHFLDTYNVNDIQLICCQADASAVWLVPPMVKNRFIKSLDYDMDIIFTWLFTRERPKGKEVVKYEITVEDVPSASTVQQVLNGSAKGFAIYNVYPRYFRVTGSGEVRRLEQTVSSVSGELVLNQESLPWWSFYDVNASDVVGCNELTGPMAIVVSEETPQGILGETLSKFSIWSLYLTFVLAVGRFIRLQCSDLRMRIPFENLPSCDRLIAICEDIYAARAEGELEVEEVLYWTLVKIYRSPHMLLEYTKPD